MTQRLYMSVAIKLIFVLKMIENICIYIAEFRNYCHRRWAYFFSKQSYENRPNESKLKLRNN